MSEIDNGVVTLHGKDYETVALRISKFREEHPDWPIETKCLDMGMYVTFRATIKNADGKIISTGHASEERGEGMINTTSALENCETSAVGRALAFYKFPGHFIRSADEMSDAVAQQAVKSLQKEYGERMKILRENSVLSKIVDLKDRLADGDYHAAAEIMLDFKDDELAALRCAPTKGGILSTREIEQMKTNEFSQARNAITGHKPRLD